MAIFLKILTLKKTLIFRQAGVLSLLLPILFLPMVHVHHVYGHIHDEVGDHLHRAVLHTHFSSVSAHGEHHHAPDHDVLRHDKTADFHHQFHSFDSSKHFLSQSTLLSFHSGSTFKLSSFNKKDLANFIHEKPDPFLSLSVQFRAGDKKRTSLRQALRFERPSLRAPPYFSSFSAS